MKRLKLEDQKNDIKNWILPENSLSQDEILAGILKAEEGPFYTVQESMENFEQWMKSRSIENSPFTFKYKKNQNNPKN